LNDDKVVNLEEYRKEKNKGTPISTLKAFLPDGYYVFPEMGLMIHVLFVTDNCIHYDEEEVYVMEDQYGNIFADVVDEETCAGWHELHKDAFMSSVEQNNPPDPPNPYRGAS
jgi:hypothetical protein